jgi:hypothetical protein
MNRLENAAVLLKHIAPSLVGVANEELHLRILKLDLPSDLTRLICITWPKEPIDIGTITLTDPVGILHHCWLKDGLADKLLPIGAGLNGDPVLLDYSIENFPIGFLCVPELYGSKTIRDCFIPCYRTLASYLEAVSRESHTPFDYYEACDMIQTVEGTKYLCDTDRMQTDG